MLQAQRFELKSAHAIVIAAVDVGALSTVRESLNRCGDPALLQELAQALPQSLVGVSPEASLELSRLAFELAPYSPVMASDVCELSPRLRSSWLRAYLCAGYSVKTPELSDLILLEVVVGWNLSELVSSTDLLKRLARSKDARLRLQAVERLGEAVERLQLPPAEAFEMVTALCEDEEACIRLQAVKRLGAAWLTSIGRPKRAKCIAKAMWDIIPAVSAQAVSMASHLGYRDEIVSALLDLGRAAQVDLALQSRLITALGNVAIQEDIKTVMGLGAEFSLSHGQSTRQFLLQAHRRGCFLHSEDLSELLELFDTHAGWTGEEFVRVSYLGRLELIERLRNLPADDSRWKRRAAILSSSYGTSAHVLLARLLDECTDPTIAVKLIAAAGASCEYVGDTPLLCWIDSLPQEVMAVLRVKAGPSTETAMRAIVDNPLSPSKERKLALDVLWCHWDDRSTCIGELSKILGPYEIGLLNSNRIQMRDGTIARLIAKAEWNDAQPDAFPPLDGETRLEILCASGDRGLCTEVIAQFRLEFQRCISKGLQGDFSARRLTLPELEQQLFIYGRHLVSDGRCVRRWIEPSPETGRDFVLDVALQWLAEGPATALMVGLLEIIARHIPSGAVLRAVEGYWRHTDKGVQRAAVAAIVASGEGARGLELSICRLTESKHPQVLRQALEAVANLGAGWAESIAIECLDRPEMSIKKAAAEALVVIATPAAVSALVFWLGRHDNSGFRRVLDAALLTAAGNSRNAILVAALANAEDQRTTELLWMSLSDVLPLDMVASLAWSEEPSQQALVEACLQGQVQLADGSADDLAKRLHRAQRLTKSEREPDPSRMLHIHGFSEAAAIRLIEWGTEKTEQVVREAIAIGLPDWLHWLSSSTEIHPAAVNLVLTVPVSEKDHFDILLSCAERLGRALTPKSLVAFVDNSRTHAGFSVSHAQRTISLLRSISPDPNVGGLKPYRLLGHLGAVRTPEDVYMALNACAIRGSYAQESATLLKEVLHIPPRRDGESYDILSLRNEAEHWSQTSPVTRDAWLATWLEQRPVDLLVAPLPTPLRTPLIAVHSVEEREQLLIALHSDDRSVRQTAAEDLLAWEDSNATSDVLSVFLSGELAGGLAGAPRQLAKLAPAVTSWPSSASQRRRAIELIPWLSSLQIRQLLPGWIACWRKGESALELNHPQVQPEVMRLALLGVLAKDYSLLALVVPSDSLAQHTLIEQLAELAPNEIAHLKVKRVETEKLEDSVEMADPLFGKDLPGLIAVLTDDDAEHGLVVRAVHAIADYGQSALPTLDTLVTDRRAKVRSAAMRALRRVATKQESAAATLRVLRMETRRDIVIRLMASLGHARYQAALTTLLDRLTHSDYRIRQGAHSALLAWGPSAIPSIENAARKARPDRRPAYMTLIRELSP